MPVIDETGHPVGVVSEADLLRRRPGSSPGLSTWLLRPSPSKSTTGW
ncbi:hypothetical protein [Streptomyces sp. NPDC092307]